LIFTFKVFKFNSINAEEIEPYNPGAA